MNDVAVSGVPSGPFPEVVPGLTDGRVLLRAMTSADLPAVVEQSNDPESVRWTTVPQPYGPDEARSFHDAHRQGWAQPRGRKHWTIELRPHEGEAGLPFAGIVDLRPGEADGHPWEVGFALHPAARGRGVMSAALRLAAGWAFEHGCQSLYWLAEQGNFASRRVAWACGFTHLGVLPARVPDRSGRALDAWAGVLRPGEPMRPRHRWIEPPVIEGNGVRLRPLRDEDRAVAEPHDHPAHHVPARAVPTPETFEAWLLQRRVLMAEGSSCHWCITESGTDDPLGEVLVFADGLLSAGGTGELGYAVRPSARGRGVAGRAARLAADHALRPVEDGGFGLRRLIASTASDNAASATILDGCGFIRWGREPDCEAPDGPVCSVDRWHRLART